MNEIGSVIEDFERWAHIRRRAAPQTPAPGPVTLAAAPPEENPMDVIGDIRNDFTSGLSKLAALDGDAVAKVDSIKATPEGAAIFETLASLADATAKAVLPPDVLPTLLATVKGVESLVQPWIAQAAAQAAQQEQAAPAEASFTPAGPAVGGQA